MSPLASAALAPAALALALVHLVACGPAPAPAPAPAPSAAPTTATAPSAPVVARAQKVPASGGKVFTVDDRAGLIPMRPGPRPAPEPPLTQEELDLLAADPATLTVELRRKRGYALRRKILQNPDSPAARQLESMRLATERGELHPQLPGDSGLVLQSPAPPAPTTTSTP